MRRIKGCEVKRLALCKRGKNGLATLYKADGTAEWQTLVKADPERGELLAVMWPKGLADEEGDFADSDEAIRSMTASLIRNGGKVDIEHKGDVLPPSAVQITEVFTIRKSDERFHGWKDYSGAEVDVTGGAAVKLQIDDPALRAKYRDGEWDGVSLFGPAAVEQVDTKAASHRVAARMGGMQEMDMTKEELQAALAAQKAEFAQLVKSAVDEALKAKTAPVEPKAEPKPAEGFNPPTFTGDPLDPEALSTYEKALRRFELQKAITSGTMTADKLAELRKSLTETQPSVEDLQEAGIEAKPEDNAKVRELQIQLFKAYKGSNAPERRGEQEDQEAKLAKAQYAESMELAKLVNAKMGIGNAPTQSMRVVPA